MMNSNTSPHYKPQAWIKLDRGDIIEYELDTKFSSEHHNKLKLKQRISFNDLPLEVVEKIMEYLQIRDILEGRIMFLNRACYMLFSFSQVVEKIMEYSASETINNAFSKLLYTHYHHYVKEHVKSIEKQMHDQWNVENILCKCIYLLDLPNHHWSHWWMIYKRFHQLVEITDIIKLYSPEKVESLHAGCMTVMTDFKTLTSRVKQLIHLDSQFNNNNNHTGKKHSHTMVSQKKQQQTTCTSSQDDDETKRFLNDFPMDVCVFWMMHDGERLSSDETCYLIGVSRLLTVSEILYHFRAEHASNMLLSEISGIFSTHLNIFTGQINSYQGWNVTTYCNWLDYLRELNGIARDTSRKEYVRVLPHSLCGYANGDEERLVYYKF